MATSHLLELRDITKTYHTGGEDVSVLHGISLTIDDGEFVAIMGQSGSGKSTLMNIIGLLDTPTSGAYLLAGQDVSRLSGDEQSEVRGKQIGFVFQSYNLLARQTALEQVMLPLMYQGISARERRVRAEAALTKVGLETRMYNRPNQLSGGQMQRVAIARALVMGNGMILADEPTGALDSKTSREVMELMKELNDGGSTIVLITHDPGVATFAKRVVHIKDGLLLDAA